MAAESSPAADAVGRIPSGIFILTAGTGSEATGMLASWVQQCSFSPLRVSVAIAPDRPAFPLLDIGKAFALNCVPEGRNDFLKHFGKGFAPGEPAFEGINTQDGPGGVPVLEGSLAILECRVHQRVESGDHHLIIADVMGGAVHGPSRPMVHIRNNATHY